MQGRDSVTNDRTGILYSHIHYKMATIHKLNYCQSLNFKKIDFKIKIDILLGRSLPMF